MNQKPKKGQVGRIYGVKVAVEVNSDGSITLAKEVIAEIVADKRVPEWVKKIMGGKL